MLSNAAGRRTRGIGDFDPRQIRADKFRLASIHFQVGDDHRNIRPLPSRPPRNRSGTQGLILLNGTSVDGQGDGLFELPKWWYMLPRLAP